MITTASSANSKSPSNFFRFLIASTLLMVRARITITKQTSRISLRISMIPSLVKSLFSDESNVGQGCETETPLKIRKHTQQHTPEQCSCCPRFGAFFRGKGELFWQQKKDLCEAALPLTLPWLLTDFDLLSRPELRCNPVSPVSGALNWIILQSWSN